MGNVMVMGLEVAVLITGLAVLLLELWLRHDQRRLLGYTAAVAVGFIFLASFAVVATEPRSAFGGMYVLDELALYFKRFFLLAALLVMLMAVGHGDASRPGSSEYHALVLFALAGMMFAASANDFSLLFVALELITVTFYILVSYERRRLSSLEAGVKYLILGALSSAFLVYGIALVYGASGTLRFAALAEASTGVLGSRVLQAGLLLVLVGLGFKMAVVPFQIWAPDVYQGAPAPTAAFLAIGSKAAGVALLLRLIFVAAPTVAREWSGVLVVLTGATILYGVLGALPQRSFQRLMGYSSIANAGYLMLGVVTFSAAGISAVLYYLAGYLFAVGAAFLVISQTTRALGTDDIPALGGLARRSPLLAGALSVAMVSLAGVPPMAGFFGKFLVLKSAVVVASAVPGLPALVGVAVVGVVISLYYYFGVIRALYWGESTSEAPPLEVPPATRWLLYGCVAGMLWLGIAPEHVVNLTQLAAQAIRP